MAEGNTPTSQGQGQGLAQVFGSVQPLVGQADKYRGQQRKLKSGIDRANQAKENAKNKAIKELQGKLVGIKTDGLWVSRDGEAFAKAVDETLNKYNGKWEDVYQDPALRREFDRDVMDLGMKVQQSKQDKAYGVESGKLYEQDPSLYSKGMEKRRDEFLTTPFGANENYRIARTAKFDLPKWTKDFITAEAANLKQTVYSKWDDINKNRTGSSSRTSIDKKVAEDFIKAQLAQDKVATEYVNEFYEGGVDKYIQDQATSLANSYKEIKNTNQVLSKGSGAEPITYSPDKLSYNASLAVNSEGEEGELTGVSYAPASFEMSIPATNEMVFTDGFDTPDKSEILATNIIGVKRLAEPKKDGFDYLNNNEVYAVVNVITGEVGKEKKREAMIPVRYVQNHPKFKLYGYDKATQDLKRRKGVSSKQSESSAPGDSIF